MLLDVNDYSVHFMTAAMRVPLNSIEATEKRQKLCGHTLYTSQNIHVLVNIGIAAMVYL